jgi:predicted GNAT family N-acyltransferase
MMNSWTSRIKVALLADRERIKDAHIPIHLKTSTNNAEELEFQISDLPNDYPALLNDDIFAKSLHLFVEGEDGEILGSIGLVPNVDEDREGIIQSFSVSESVRGQGLGTSLLNRTLLEAKTLKYSKLTLVTLPGRMDVALNMYLKYGFKETERKPAGSPLFILSFLEKQLE